MEETAAPEAALSFLSPFGESFHGLLGQPSELVPHPRRVVGCAILLEAFPSFRISWPSGCSLFHRAAYTLHSQRGRPEVHCSGRS